MAGDGRVYSPHSLFAVVSGVADGFLEYALDSSMATALARRVIRVGTLHLLLAACVLDGETHAPQVRRKVKVRISPNLIFHCTGSQRRTQAPVWENGRSQTCQTSPRGTARIKRDDE